MKALPKNLLTIYGRKPVLEALQDPSIAFFRVHLADSNRAGGIVQEIVDAARQRNIEVCYHDRMGLSRISKNKKQDQGVAADLVAKNFQIFDDFIENPPNRAYSILALDRITNPQNLGMIIRSISAGTLDAVLIPRQGCAKIDPLVIKASAGTLFKATVLFCDDLPAALQRAKQQGAAVFGFTLEDSTAIQNIELTRPNILVLGNETDGISPATLRECNHRVHIPMRHGVESLNVSVTAGILGFRELFTR